MQAYCFCSYLNQQAALSLIIAGTSLPHLAPVSVAESKQGFIPKRANSESVGGIFWQARVLFPHSRVINLDIELNAIQLQKTTRLQATLTTPYRGV